MKHVVMYWQEWIVFLLLAYCAVLIIRRFYTFFQSSKKNINPCDSCVSGCELRKLYEEKRSKCGCVQDGKKKKLLQIVW